MKRRPSASLSIGAATAALLVLFACYMGTYYAILEGKRLDGSLATHMALAER